MSVARKAAIREMATTAYELNAGVANGRLGRAAGGAWTIGDTPLANLLQQYDGKQVCLIVASLEDEHPLLLRTCRTCGSEYEGVECPRCREVRIRLRGR
ncbi:MAG: hypothetical protein JW900_08790 [Anaerolineae bacterium]|nr:hypothetical protein [Anaerolineae bacterium]